MARGIFATPLRNDCADAPYILQSAYTVDSGPPFITSYLSMAGGGIIATTSDGVIVGTSNEAPMAQHGGVLTFALEPVNTNSPPDPGVYCVQVRAESLGF